MADELDTAFDELVAQLDAIKERLKAAGRPLEALSLAKMAEYTADNTRGRHGAVIYGLKAPGLDTNVLRTSMRAYYRKRFSLRDDGLT